MDKYEAIINLISQSSEIVDFGEFGSGVSNFWIDKAQDRLNVIFPPSYVWWLKNYSGGYILGDEVYSIYEKEFGTFIGGDIVYINELDRKNKFTDSTQLVLQRNDQGQTYYFDLLNPDENGEYPVYRELAGHKTKYADDFLGFLVGRIQDEY
jgi:hypothetical protein